MDLKGSIHLYWSRVQTTSCPTLHLHNDPDIDNMLVVVSVEGCGFLCEDNDVGTVTLFMDHSITLAFSH